jgi:hypothetical protein
MVGEKMNVSGIEISVRSPQPSDINFILSTALKGLYYGSKFWAEIDQDCFFKNYEPFLKTLMLKFNIKVACLEDDPDVILGWIMHHNETVDFVFVKKSYRKLGIARLLWPDNVTTVSHITDIGNAVRKKMNLKFNPFDV